MIRLLHAGCGSTPLPAFFSSVVETRLDIDAETRPDIVASMTELGDIGPFDMIWCSHALEHLYPADGVRALKEFHRVLVPDGKCMIVVPDVEDVKPTFDTLFEAEAGPISGHDLYYGYKPWINPHMAHRMAYVQQTLQAAIESAGFRIVNVLRQSLGYQMLGIGIK